MPQFDLHALPDGTWIVNAQSDLIDTPGTTFVIPLIQPDDDARAVERLNPVMLVDGEPHLLATHLAGAVSSLALGRPRGSLAEHDLVIKSALDMLISGF